jgi:nicotinamidase-related amidase
MTSSQPAMGRTALLLIDMVNPMEFDSADDLFAEAVPVAERIACFASRARAAGIPVIYANDNFGSWHVGFSTGWGQDEDREKSKAAGFNSHMVNRWIKRHSRSSSRGCCRRRLESR